MTEGALSGVKVVEYGRSISAPYCTKLMADLGAEVIKIEDPDSGDESRHHGPFLDDIPHPERSGLFIYLNTNKLGITLNVKTPTGNKLIKNLLKDADVFVENSSPKLMRELGLDYDSLKELNPRLIITSITPFGQTGPYRDYRAYDINCSAVGALSCCIGSPDRNPLNLPLSQCDYQGGVSGAIGTLIALLARDVTSRGQHVDVSEAEVIGYYAGIISNLYFYQGFKWIRAGHRSYKSGGWYPYTILPCKDGFICMMCRSGHPWKKFIEAIGNPEWTKSPRYRDRARMGREYPDEVDALLQPWLREHTRREIVDICRERGIPFSAVRTIDEVVDCPHLKEREFFVEIYRQETGVLKYPGAPFKLSNTPWRIERPAPLLGEHNEMVYCERLGCSKKELIRLRRGGSI